MAHLREDICVDGLLLSKQLLKCVYRNGQQTFSVNDQIASILAFVGHRVSVQHRVSCPALHGSTKVATDNT